MAASAGEDDIQDHNNPTENVTKPLNSTAEQQDVNKPGESSSNGTVSSSLGCANILRASAFSTSASPSPAFGSTPSFGNSSQKNSFSLRPSVFGSFGSSDKDSGLKPSVLSSRNNTSNWQQQPGPKKPVVLRASQLESVTGSPVSSSTVDNANSSFVLSPAKLSKPFIKAESDKKDECSSAVSSTSSEDSSKTAVKADSSSSNSIPEVGLPKVSFVPLANSASANKPETPRSVGPAAGSTSVPSFVFGQNLHERVEVPTESSHRDSEASDGMVSDANSCDSEVSKTNGTTSEMLFTSVIQRELPEKQSEVGSEEKKRKSLSEAAREYEESRAVKRKYEEVAVKTGEEEEINVLQINCKLFAFNKEKSTWVERGRGTLRVNDLALESRTQSRVVMRVSGSLRVVLNTKIWAEMAVDRPSEKSVRLTAMDSSGEIKVFLVMAGVKEVDQLFKALEWRVNNQKKLASTCEKNSETNES